jgi:hypothetical protein
MGTRGMYVGFWWESKKERDHWEYLDGGGRVILKWIREIRWGGMDWIDLAQDRDQWRTVVNTVMKFLLS